MMEQADSSAVTTVSPSSEHLSSSLLDAGSIFSRNSTPIIHRTVNLANAIQGDSEYVMVNKRTKMIGLVILGESPTPTASGYHALVYPTAEMTLDSFIERFSARSNGQLCNLVVDDEYAESADESEDDSFETVPLTGVDVPLSSLIKLINSFRTSNNAAIRRLASSIRHAIVSTKSKSWNTLVENRNVASCIYVFLHLLSNTVDPLQNISVGIFIESLQDLLDERYRFSNDWEVVNLTQGVNNALLLNGTAAVAIRAHR